MAKVILNPDGSPAKYLEKEIFSADYSNVVKEVNAEKRKMTITGTDETRDRDRDIIRISGWNLENYKKNPVFLWAHSYDSVPLARTIKITKKRDPLRMVFEVLFPTKGIYPFADMIFELYGEKIINACSVGFIPYKWNIIEEEDEKDNPNSYFKGKEFIQQELLELSGCAVPSNPNALQNALMGKSFGFNPDDLVKFITGTQLIPRPDKEDDVVEEMGKSETELVDETSSVSVQVPENLESSFDEEVEKLINDIDQMIEDLSIIEDGTINKEDILKPYPNEHACRLVDPDEFDEFARKNCFRKIDNKCIDFIFGIKEGKSKVQAMRFNKDVWDAAKAKKVCDKAKGSFEAARSPKSKEEEKEAMDGLTTRVKKCEMDIKKLMTRMDEIGGKSRSSEESLMSISDQIRGFQDSLAKALEKIQRNPRSDGGASSSILRDVFCQRKEVNEEVPQTKYNEESLKTLKEALLVVQKALKQINLR